MLKKFMAKLGVGSAKVDLVLHKREWMLGEDVEGALHIEGGTVEQDIRQILVELAVKLTANGKAFSHRITSIPVASSFVIRPGEKKILPFTYRLPNNLPISRRGVSYSFVTRLDIAGGVDHFDSDTIQVLPPARFANIIRALEMLGLREKADSGKLNGYLQAFAFFPTTHYKNRLEEVELAATIEENGIRLFLEVDMIPYPLGFGERELRQEIFLENKQLDNVQALSAHLRMIIEEMLQNPEPYRFRHASGKPAHGHVWRHGHRGSGMTEAMGGFVAGMLGGMLLNELFDSDGADGAGETGGEGLDLGGFDFGDFFGGGDSGGFGDGGGFGDSGGF
ncbi:MAG: hypothetical protein BAA01_04930 [Bacillus thermozeamaize]|uniref:Sporulation protein SpoOM n=1 Tax=Bacillus thermozeamaize TaxID=230954 RepID=A0A1Y3PR54_9BACI|nr:MAG: hypothetical protein BAA01_04930 [Bacillus thermozeamaize]